MGIPVWKPKKQQQQENSLHSTFQHQHSITPHYRLHRRRQPTLLAEPYYIAADGYTTSTAPTSISSSRLGTSASRTRLQNTMAARQQLEIETQIQQRFNEKQELLDQLKITISLLDQFLSIREISGQQLALPPFITDDLLAILTATTLISTNDTTDADPLTTIPPTNHDNTLPPPPSPPSPPSRMPLRSYDRPDNDTSLTRLVDRMIGSPPHASRWAELESNIASTHRRVCEQLDRLGTSLSTTTTTSSSFSSASHFTTSRPMQSSPRQSL